MINSNAETNKILHPVWAGKAKLAYNKLKRFENEDDEIREIIQNYKKKYHQVPDDMNVININKNNENSKAVFMGLNQNGVIAFFVLLLVCFPLVWLPFIIPQFKAE